MLLLIFFSELDKFLSLIINFFVDLFVVYLFIFNIQYFTNGGPTYCKIVKH